jgi:hypothetical protein
MIEVAEVFRRFAADYLSAHGASGGDPSVTEQDLHDTDIDAVLD